MPEGDTVARTARRLDRALRGRTLIRCDVRVPAYATVDLSGRQVDEVLSRGKHLLIRVGQASIHSHLKMEGRWDVYAPGARWRRPRTQARIVLGVRGAEAVGFELGTLAVLARSEEQRVLGHLGPDLLGADWDPARAVANLAADPSRPIGEALLDQRNLAGIGNVYRSEICFLLGIMPTVPVGEVDLPRIVDLAHRLLDANRDRVQRVTTGVVRDPLWVYGRRGGCRRCGTPVRRAHLGVAASTSGERVAYWCPSCQK